MQCSDSNDMSVATKFYLLSNASKRWFELACLQPGKIIVWWGSLSINKVKKDSDKLHAYLQMSQATFNYLLHLIQLNIKSQAYENFHANPITAEEMLLVTLR